MFSKKILFGIAIIFCFWKSTTLGEQPYSVTLQNGIQVDSYTYEFDIYINSNIGEFDLTSYQSSLVYNDVLTRKGEISFLYIQGTSQLSIIPSLGIGVKKNNDCDVLTFASLPGSDTIDQNEKRIGRFLIGSSVPFSGNDLNIFWNFNGKLTTIVTSSNFVDITDPTCFYSYIGPMSDDLVSNGTFNSDTNWINQSAWSIGGGVAICNGSSNNSVYQASIFAQNTTYLITFDITSYTSGTMTIYGQGNNTGAISGVGSKAIYFTTGSNGDDYLYIQSLSFFIGSIDNVTIKELFNDRDNITDNKDVEQNYKYSLLQNYPNPFNPSTKIKFSIPQGAFVQIKIYNAIGQEINTLVNKYCFSGIYEVNFGNKNLPSGLYIYSLIVDSKIIDSKKMIFLK